LPGRIKTLIDEYFERRCGTNASLRHFVRATLMLKGINPDKFDERSPDDPATLATLQRLLTEFDRPRKTDVR
jgi:hypothetical protein